MEPRGRAAERLPRRRVEWGRRLLRHARPTRLRLWWWALVSFALAGALAFQASAGDSVAGVGMR
jgi:hypothetical protein